MTIPLYLSYDIKIKIMLLSKVLKIQPLFLKMKVLYNNIEYYVVAEPSKSGQVA